MVSWSQVTFSAWVKSAMDVVTSTVRLPVVLRVAAFVKNERERSSARTPFDRRSSRNTWRSQGLLGVAASEGPLALRLIGSSLPRLFRRFEQFGEFQNGVFEILFPCLEILLKGEHLQDSRHIRVDKDNRRRRVMWIGCVQCLVDNGRTLMVFGERIDEHEHGASIKCRKRVAGGIAAAGSGDFS